jgi:seryl-tRNA synthetase
MFITESWISESRRLEVRCGIKSKDQTRKVYVHMLNGTLIAAQRALCCVVENYQTAEVSVLPLVYFISDNFVA